MFTDFSNIGMGPGVVMATDRVVIVGPFVGGAEVSVETQPRVKARRRSGMRPRRIRIREVHQIQRIMFPMCR